MSTLRDLFITKSGLHVPERRGVEMMLRVAEGRTGQFAMVPAAVFDEIEAELRASECQKNRRDEKLRAGDARNRIAMMGIHLKKTHDETERLKRQTKGYDEALERAVGGEEKSGSELVHLKAKADALRDAAWVILTSNRADDHQVLLDAINAYDVAASTGDASAGDASVAALKRVADRWGDIAFGHAQELERVREKANALRDAALIVVEDANIGRFAPTAQEQALERAVAAYDAAAPTPEPEPVTAPYDPNQRAEFFFGVDRGGKTTSWARQEGKTIYGSPASPAPTDAEPINRFATLKRLDDHEQRIAGMERLRESDVAFYRDLHNSQAARIAALETLPNVRYALGKAQQKQVPDGR